MQCFFSSDGYAPKNHLFLSFAPSILCLPSFCPVNTDKASNPLREVSELLVFAPLSPWEVLPQSIFSIAPSQYSASAVHAKAPLGGSIGQ